ncbi:50S ribosomal protein-related [Striga hermonthica]|uniref:50S ribosomal protein-related n=1 Tax=Striga hermonthica TaxID=68872 RepID=A0A9N7R7P6_STRHE|nr:50S ribosomal protein-related [Striga hermonthica]
MATLQKFKLLATQCAVAGSPSRSPASSPVIHFRRRKTLRMLLGRAGGGGGRRLPPDRRRSLDRERSREKDSELSSVSHKLRDLFVSSPPPLGEGLLIRRRHPPWWDALCHLAAAAVCPVRPGSRWVGFSAEWSLVGSFVFGQDLCDRDSSDRQWGGRSSGSVLCLVEAGAEVSPSFSLFSLASMGWGGRRAPVVGVCFTDGWPSPHAGSLWGVWSLGWTDVVLPPAFPAFLGLGVGLHRWCWVVSSDGRWSLAAGW